MPVESARWDPRTQLQELNARKRYLDGDLMISGGLLGVVAAILMAELLSVNEDTNTFLVVCGLGLTLSLGWLLAARRAGAREMAWIRKARHLEETIFTVPDPFRVWDEVSKEGLPAWIAMAAVQVAFVIVWAGLMAYAFWSTYL